jgi:two-component system, chemotaxis family, sensor kinase CheA
MNPKEAQLRAKFLALAQDRLRRMGELVTRLSDVHEQDETLRQLGRELHTFKGEARVLDFTTIATLAHVTEDVLRHFQSDPEEVAELLFRGFDALFLCVHSSASGSDDSSEVTDATRVALREWLEARGERKEPAAGPLAKNRTLGSSGAARPVPEARAAPSPAGSATTAARMLRIPMAELDVLSGFVTEASSNSVLARARTRELLGVLESFVSLLRETLEDDPAALRGAGKALEEHALRLTRAAHAVSDAEMRVDSSLGYVNKTVREIRLQPLDDVFNSHRSFVRSAAREAGKEVQVVVTGGDTAVDQRVIARVEEPLLHLVRNAVTHGLESPEEREKQGKRRAGTIRIEARQEGERVRVTVADDGRGFDVPALIESAIAAGQLGREAAATLPREQAIDLAFAAGVSTAAGTDQMAGRGIGLDVVRSTVESTGGNVNVATEAGVGTTWILYLPVTLSLQRVMTVEASGSSFAIPTSSILGVQRLAVREIEKVDGGEVTRQNGKLLPLVRLREVACVRGIRDIFVNKLGLVTVQHGDRVLGVLVDRIRGQREIVSRALPALLGSWPLVSGVTTTESGRVLPILRVSDLFEFGAERSRASALASAEGGTRALRRIVYAEDSFITREYVAMMLRSVGFAVTEVGDGAEALMALRRERPDLLLTDLQMPNVDGFELLRKVRADPILQGLPIVVISTLESDDVRRMAMDAGADAYLLKSQFSPESVTSTLRHFFQ